MITVLSSLEAGLLPLKSWLVFIGFLLWILAYVLILRASARDQTYGVPWGSICLNLGWEFYFGFVCPGSADKNLCPDTRSIWLIQIWFFLDALIFLQMMRYKLRTLPGLRKILFLFGVLAFLAYMALAEPLFVYRNKDIGGVQISWILNLVMSFLFIGLFFLRPKLEGLSYGAAWAKMAGTLAMVPAVLPALSKFYYFVALLAVGTLLADLVYIILLTIRRRQLGGGGEPEPLAQAA